MQSAQNISSSDSQPVTSIISHRIKAGREQDYEDWFRGIVADAQKFKGHSGVSVITPQDHNHLEYVTVLRFDCYANLKTWMESDIRNEWIARLQPMIESPESVQTLTGLETWFSLPQKPRKLPPPRYKMVLITWIGVFFTLSIMSRLLAPLLAGWPIMLSQLITTGLVVAILTYIVMPKLTQIFRFWLYPSSEK